MYAIYYGEEPNGDGHGGNVTDRIDGLIGAQDWSIFSTGVDGRILRIVLRQAFLSLESCEALRSSGSLCRAARTDTSRLDWLYRLIGDPQRAVQLYSARLFVQFFQRNDETSAFFVRSISIEKAAFTFKSQHLLTLACRGKHFVI